MVPFLDLKAQYASIREEAETAVSRVLASGHYVLGEDVAAFEKEFAEYCGAEFGVGVNSGTSALHLALLSAGIGPGDEVITVPFTFIATVAAISYTGAKPVFVDIDEEGFAVDVSLIEQKITSRTRAIIPVHLYGQMADMDPILEISDKHGLAVIEDAAQAHGAAYRGLKAGSMGNAACFSFYPGKNLGACGEGGILVTKDPAMAETARMLRDWGQTERYHHDRLGFNYRMDGIQGAILRIKLGRLSEWNAKRRTVAAWYDEMLSDVGVQTPSLLPAREHVYHIYAIRTQQRNLLREFLDQNFIGSGLHYPLPVHLQSCMAHHGYQVGDFPKAEKAANEVLSLPIFPELTRKDQETVVAVVRDFFR